MQSAGLQSAVRTERLWPERTYRLLRISRNSARGNHFEPHRQVLRLHHSVGALDVPLSSDHDRRQFPYPGLEGRIRTNVALVRTTRDERG